MNLRRKAAKPLDPAAAREIVVDYLAWQVVVNSGESILYALDLEQRYGISFWDALIGHAAEVSGASASMLTRAATALPCRSSSMRSP